MKILHNGQLIYKSQPKQTIFHADQNQCRLYGGAAGGGKTFSMLWEIFALCTDERFPLLNGAVFRKTYPAVEEFFIRPALDVFPKSAYRYDRSKHLMTFAKTNSRVKFAYCESEADVTNYQGAGWDFLAIDELTQHTEYVFKYLFHRLRTDKSGWKTKFFAGTNPGGPGHNFVKRIWVDNDLLPEEKPFSWSFTKALLDDNPRMLEKNPNYEDQLMLIPDEMIRRAMRYGDWNIFAGQFFTELRQDIHGFEPFEIPKEWDRVIGLDYGWDHPSAVYWAAVDEVGDVWIYKELVTRHRTYTELGELIMEMTTADEKISYVVADPSIWAKKGNAQGASGAEELQNVLDRRKINLTPADNDRVNGWGIMREWLRVRERQGKQQSRLHISNVLKWWWKTVPEVQRDPKKPEDVWKMEGDDSADASRYLLMSRPRPTVPKVPQPKRDRHGYNIKKARNTQPQWLPAQKPVWRGRV